MHKPTPQREETLLEALERASRAFARIRECLEPQHPKVKGRPALRVVRDEETQAPS